LAAALAAWSCGGSQPAKVRSLQVVLETDAAFAQHPDFSARLENTIQAALDYWGGDWTDLEGATLTITDAPTVSCAGRQSLGCYDQGALRVTTQDPSIGTFSCVESTVLVHEIGHAVIGDPSHEDPRWMEMDPLGQELSGRPGYDSSGSEPPPPCQIYLSVWRHPPGAP
jgi:hypothetical protein